MIALLSPTEALDRLSRSVLLPAATESDKLSDMLLAQIVRRAINFMSPCAPHELVKAVWISFGGASSDVLRERIERIVEDLIVYGDILEMRADDEDGWHEAGSFMLRPAPPSFVKRQDGSIAIIGIAGEEITPLTRELNLRVVYSGALRIISPSAHEDLDSILIELGLFKLSESAWLRIPTFERAADHIAYWLQKLSLEPNSSSIDDLQILDTAQSPLNYKRRWTSPSPAHSGMYVARRPQRYGAALWCVVELEKGRLRRFKDLSMRGDRLRPFDIAWRIQAALDAVAGYPQCFDTNERGAPNTLLRLYSPVPSWCERYLSIAGQRGFADKCLLSFQLPNAQLASETRFLTEALWMTERT